LRFHINLKFDSKTNDFPDLGMAKLVSIRAVVYIDAPYKDMDFRLINLEECNREREEFRRKAHIAFTFENHWKTSDDIRIMIMGQWIDPRPPPSFPSGYHSKPNPRFTYVDLV